MKKVLICFWFLSSCISNNSMDLQEGDPGTGPPYIISLEDEVERVIPAGLSEIGSSITYIPLETSAETLLKGLRQIVVTDSYLAVNDRDSLLLFDHSGGFLRQISRKGYAQGEYSMFLWDYCFSPDGNKIYLLINSHECLEYGVEGEFLNSYKMDSMPNRMLPFNENLFVFYTINMPKQINPIEQSLIISDLNDNIEKAYKNHHKKSKVPTVAISDGVPFYSYQENIRFKEEGADTLYTVTLEGLTPYAVFDLGKKEMPTDLHTPKGLDDALIPHEGKFFLRKIFEDVDNLYLRLYDFRKYLYGYYNKEGNTVKVMGEEGFQNDIDGGLPFFPMYVYNDSVLVDYIQPIELRRHISNSNAAEMRQLYGQKYDDLVQLANSLEDDSNPVIVMVKK